MPGIPDDAKKPVTMKPLSANSKLEYNTRHFLLKQSSGKRKRGIRPILDEKRTDDYKRRLTLFK